MGIAFAAMLCGCQVAGDGDAPRPPLAGVWRAELRPPWLDAKQTVVTGTMDLHPAQPEVECQPREVDCASYVEGSARVASRALAGTEVDPVATGAWQADGSVFLRIGGCCADQIVMRGRMRNGVIRGRWWATGGGGEPDGGRVTLTRAR